MAAAPSELLRQCKKCGALAVESLLSVDHRIEDERAGGLVVYPTGTTEYWKCARCGHRFSLQGMGRAALSSFLALVGLAVGVAALSLTSSFWALIVGAVGGAVALAGALPVVLTVVRRLQNPLGSAGMGR